ncbi:MAG: SAM-dependent chlorinase/fluorinase [Planctomycetes bacterium]|nr:SAM-dependent chlorinase/fluorinase [Planctomycetota bacterium]
MQDAERLVTLTTDFGEGSPYVAAMKGVLLSANPSARVVDLGHSIPPQDVRHAAFFLASCLPYFPSGTIHVIVVDPGVGTERALLHIEAGGHHLLAPDNGCWTLAAAQLTKASPNLPTLTVRRLTEPRFWRHPVSSTFHGRDILAPVAAFLSLGGDPKELGCPVAQWVRHDLPAPVLEPQRLAGEVVFVDPFGNLLTNIPGEAFLTLASEAVRVVVGTREGTRVVRTYGEAGRGTLIALVSSCGLLEVAVAEGNAAHELGGAAGTPVVVNTLPTDSHFRLQI